MSEGREVTPLLEEEGGAGEQRQTCAEGRSWQRQDPLEESSLPLGSVSISRIPLPPLGARGSLLSEISSILVAL